MRKFRAFHPFDLYTRCKLFIHGYYKLQIEIFRDILENNVFTIEFATLLFAELLAATEKLYF